MGHSPRKIAYANSFFYKVWFDTTKKKKASLVNQEMLRKALKEQMKDGKSIRAAAKDNNVPRDNGDKTHHNTLANGSKLSELTTEQEQLIVVAL